jgi:hypothetical protein
MFLRGAAQGHHGCRYVCALLCVLLANALELTASVGHYEVQQWDEHSRSFRDDQGVGLFITVEEVFDNDHRIVSQRGERKGRFTFSAADSGEHKICFSPLNSVAYTGYLSNGQEVGGVKLIIDMAVGETSNIESSDKEKINDIVQKVRDLNGRLQDIRREQMFQRVGFCCALNMVLSNV